ncbi:hypothetical protein [Rufibacter sp. XAAS-G3-1]|uniref:hypothetical protein n=1 Tax=Rufibacter sp. XAAS-G3-1 TaxID=2729134 RepID=UPI0015E70C9B|nr:hypothetical protein [Rufibacter sp. XAAS-G3-1]
MTDIVIEMLKFGKNNLDNGFTKKQMTDYLQNSGFNSTNNSLVIDLYFRKYFTFFTPIGQQPIQNNSTIYFLEPEGYFDLLQHQSTVESTNLSRRANLIGSASIFVALVALGISLVPLLKYSEIDKGKEKLELKSIDEPKNEQGKNTQSLNGKQQLLLEKANLAQDSIKK